MHRVFGYLAFSDLVPASHTCRAWYNAACSEACRGVLLTDAVVPRVWFNTTSSLREYPASASSAAADPALCRTAAPVERLRTVLRSPLRRHVTTIENSLLDLGSRYRVRHLTQANRAMPLTRLHLALCEYPEASDAETRAPLEASYSPYLTDLALSFYLVREKDMASVVRAIGSAQLLRELTLLNLHASVPIDSLRELPRLTSLRISFKTKLYEGEHDHALTVLMQLKLTRLSLNDGKLTAREIALLPRFPHILRTFDLSETRMRTGGLAALHERLPGLTSIAPFGLKAHDLPQLKHFLLLSSVTFNAGLVSHEPFTDVSVMESLRGLAGSSLTQICFHTWCPQDPAAWTALFEALPQLTSISLGVACPRSLDFLALPAVARALKTLRLVDCNLAADQFDVLLRSLPQCTSLAIHLDAFPALSPQHQFDALNSPEVMPRLAFLRLEAPQKRPRVGVRAFEWDTRARKNAHRYRLPVNNATTTATATQKTTTDANNEEGSEADTQAESGAPTSTA